MRIGVFGGSFDPPHIGHLIVAEAARVQCGLDLVLWVPNNVPPHKELDGGASTSDRIRMVKLAIRDNPAFEYSDMEVAREGPSYMVDTLRLLKVEYPGHDMYLIIGADSLVSFHLWRAPDQILELADLIVYPRYGQPQDEAEERFKTASTFIDAPRVEVSSTLLRTLLSRRQSTRYLVPSQVGDYIDARKLYTQ